jgi:hypothetical protein
MLYNKPNIVVQAKLSTEERFKQILARPRNHHAQVRLAMPKLQPKIKQGNK